MTTLLTILIALLAQLPADARLDWNGQKVAPSVLIQELKIMEEQANTAAPVEETTPVESAPEEATPEEAPATPQEKLGTEAHV